MQIVLRNAFVNLPKNVPRSITGIFNSLALFNSISSLFIAAV